MAKKQTGAWFVYILECQNGRLYTGITTDIERRFRDHCSGKGAMFTRFNKPLRILRAKRCMSRSEASKLEWAVKQLALPAKRLHIAKWAHIEGLINQKAK